MWLTHGDFDLDARVAFLAVAAHRFITAKGREEWRRLSKRGIASVWALASHDSSHVCKLEISTRSQQKYILWPNVSPLGFGLMWRLAGLLLR